ncbi:MAG TPA: hypothetical protein VLF40_05575 [Candidatus Saccharimonadales bacterium]|nr:hypothetical protein [Candidatus Saccharimonadales bacterium]
MRLKAKLFGLVSVVSIITLGLAQHAGAAVNLDPTFGLAGVTGRQFGNDASVAIGGMALQPDGKIVVVGTASNGSNTDWEIARYESDGTPDFGFGDGGVVTRDFGGDDGLGAVAIQGDGKIVVGGYSRIAPGNARWTLGRFNSDGSPDFTFGTLGLSLSFLSNSSNVTGLKIRGDLIIASGYTNGPGTVSDDIVLAGYKPDGTPDVTFGFGGATITGVNAGSTPNDRGNAIAFGANGHIFVYGDYDTGQHVDHVVLARYVAIGVPDTNFGNNGFVTDNFSSHNGGRAIAAQFDGKLVVTGTTCASGSGSCNTYVARYLDDGSRDPNFGSNGVTIRSFASGDDGGNAVAIQPDPGQPTGKILVVGSGQDGTGSRSIISRFNSDGTIDTSFGTNGSFVPTLGADGDGLSAAAMQSNGKLVVAGAKSNGSYNDWVLARTNILNNDRPQVFILLQGINTELRKDQITTHTTPEFGSVQDAITQVVPNAQFVTYSYMGPAKKKDPTPKAYGCLDTHTQTINQDIQALDKQIQAVLSTQPNAQIYLVGHSLGGVVAYGYIAALQAQGIVTPLHSSNIAGVVLFDSPFGGVSDDSSYRDYETLYFENSCDGYTAAQDNAVRNLETIFRSVPSSSATPFGGRASVLSIPFDKKAVLPNPLPNNQTLAAYAHFGSQQTNVLTIGNTLDRLWLPDTCGIPVTQFRHTQWLVDEGDNSGVYGRAISAGFPDCNADVLLNRANHFESLSHPSSLHGLQEFVTGETPLAIDPAPGES